MRLITNEMREEYIAQMDEEYPGYRDEREKLYTFVKIFTGVRVIYSLFYIGLCMMCGLDVTEGLVNLLSTAVFYFWYTLLLQSGWGVAALMLAARAIGLGIGGAGLLSNAPWLVAAAPGAVAAAVIFTLIAGMAMQFFEAVFCIYVLFNRQASMTVKLNRAMSVYFSKKAVSRTTLEQMAGYRNEAAEENQEGQEERGEEHQADDENEKFT